MWQTILTASTSSNHLPWRGEAELSLDQSGRMWLVKSEGILSAETIRTSLVVIQPTPFCNIDCSYCYLAARDDRSKLSVDAVKAIFERLLTFPTIREQVSVVWHAGEPLVMGAAYYEAAFSCMADLAKGAVRIDHAIQTNGLLINDEWCDLFRRWDVGLGLSIDGPKGIHDAARRTRTNEGTYDRAIAGMKCLRRNEIPFYVISVLTKTALQNPDAIFTFLRDHDITDIGFNVEEQEGMHMTSSLNERAIDAPFLQFFSRLADLMREHHYPIAIRELEQALAAIRSLQGGQAQNDQTAAFRIISIDVRGNVYTFSPELVGCSSKDYQTFAVGNIFRDTFDQLSKSAILRRMADEIARGVEICRKECDYFGVCSGGAPSNKLFERGTFACAETMYCRLTKKRITDFVLRAIERRSPGISKG